MSSVDNKLLGDFLIESKTLVGNMKGVLAGAEGNFAQAQSLEKYSNYSDRIMGAANTLAQSSADLDQALQLIGDYAGVCKIVGSKSALINDNEQLYDIAVALLMDGTDVLEAMLLGLQTGKLEIKQLISTTFIDRLRWLLNQFVKAYEIEKTDVVDIHKGQSVKLSQEDVDELLNKLGF